MSVLALALFSFPSFAASLVDSGPGAADLPTVVVADAAVFEALDPDVEDIMGFMHMAAGTQDAFEACRDPLAGEVVFHFDEGCVIEAFLPSDGMPPEPVSWNVVLPVPSDADRMLGIGWGGPTAVYLASVDAVSDWIPVLQDFVQEDKNGSIVACNFNYEAMSTREFWLIVAHVEVVGDQGVGPDGAWAEFDDSW